MKKRFSFFNLCLRVLLLSIAILVSACQKSDPQIERPSTKESKGLYERWAPKYALADANDDIANDKVRVYLHGGYAAILIGIEYEDQDLVKDLPRDDAGIGCIVFDEKLRSMQGEYATIYNKRIVEWIKETHPKREN